MTQNTRVRAGAESALAPGIRLQRDNLGRRSKLSTSALRSVARHDWVITASAQIDGRQQRKRIGILKRPLATAIRLACEWRAERVTGLDAAKMEQECWRRLSPRILSRLRDDGIVVARPANLSPPGSRRNAFAP